MSNDDLLSRLSRIESELVSLSAECGTGSRGRIAVRCVTRALQEIVMAKSHVIAQRSLDQTEWSKDLT